MEAREKYIRALEHGRRRTVTWCLMLSCDDTVNWFPDCREEPYRNVVMGTGRMSCREFERVARRLGHIVRMHSSFGC